MPDAMVLPLLLAAGLGLAVALCHRRVPPSLATRATTVVLVLVAAVAVPTVWMAGLSFLTHAPLIGDWLDSCVGHLTHHHAVNPLIGVPAVALAALGTWRAVAVLRTYLHLRHTDGGVHVVEHPEAFAFTTPGRGGRIIVSTTLEQHLTADELHVVLAHERAHARHRHDRYLLAAQLAAALLVPLHPLVNRLRFSVERWADEEAVRECGDRNLVARTLGRVALIGTATQPALAFAGLGVPARMTALMSPPVHGHRRLQLLGLTALIGLTAVFAALQMRHLVDMVLAFCLG
ncbi:MAG: hypothetical protein RL238_709 [Actinomycetota bacterium]|jgi:hypothetical protein